MGYTTYFAGAVSSSPSLDPAMIEYLKKSACTHRMKRDPQKLEEMGYGPTESFGIDGEFFVEGKGLWGQDVDESVVDSNAPPGTQPGLWCQWVPTKDGAALQWDGEDKFYNAAEWMTYLIDTILAPRGYSMNGLINAQGEDEFDSWHLAVNNNQVRVYHGHSDQAPIPSIPYD